MVDSVYAEVKNNFSHRIIELKTHQFYPSFHQKSGAFFFSYFSTERNADVSPWQQMLRLAGV